MTDTLSPAPSSDHDHLAEHVPASAAAPAEAGSIGTAGPAFAPVPPTQLVPVERRGPPFLGGVVVGALVGAAVAGGIVAVAHVPSSWASTRQSAARSPPLPTIPISGNLSWSSLRRSR